MNFKDFYKNYTIVSEVYFTDIFSKNFKTFHDKWKKQKNRTDLFVRFDNGESHDVLAKGASKNPTHQDPLGVYAYPLKYVIDHPADIWYGHNSKYLKVIQNINPRKTVILSSMEEWFARSLLRKIGLEDNYDLAAKFYPERAKGRTAPGKLFMSCILMDFTDADSPKSKKQDKKKPTIRSGKEQADLLLKMGIYAVEDRSKTIKQAAINNREPEQIFWLVPHAFQILETFILSDSSTYKSNVKLEMESIVKKLAAKIANVLDDSIVDLIYNSFSGSKFWTKKQRLIEVDFTDESLGYRMKNLKMGEKPHKMYKKFDPHSFQINIKSERKEIQFKLYNFEKIDESLSKLKNIWLDTPIENPDRKFSKALYLKKIKEEEEQRLREIEEKNRKDIITGWKEKFIPLYNKLANHFNLDLIKNDLSDDSIVDTYRAMKRLSDNKDYFENMNMNIFNDYKYLLNINNIQPRKISEPMLNLNDIDRKIFS